jgi:hypothetical protein
LKSFEEVYNELRPKLEEVEEYRVNLRKKSQTTVIVGAVILLVSIMIGLLLNQPLIYIGAVVGIIVGAVGFFTHQSKYKKEFKTKVVPALLDGLNPGMSYHPKGYIDKVRFKASGIFQHSIDRYSGEDHIKGTIDKTDVEFSELHAQYKTTTTDSKGRTRTSYHTFFKGLYMIADFHKEFNGRTLVLPDNAEKLFGGVFGKWFQKMNFSRDDLIYMEDPEFEKEFVVYGTDQIESRYILSTHMLRDILELKRKCNCPIFLSFNNSVVHLAIYWSKDLLEPSFGKEITQSSEVKKFYDELGACFQIVEDLNLNTRIWSKQ